ncbi:RNA deprotection pyrophosphohydrolase [Amphibacillus cookii]|uniref:RNA deprotection pyrophosphohydrolase n=1 Tax=Amphibacillus cookii TaxID=767787 RepID=UPI00195D1E9C|nr:nucleoside triphosphatase YtkD [Amphibacillus cookii]MBM7541408.1 8-oxo-dGTP diphosphatase [Amphibacillus cookii]
MYVFRDYYNNEVRLSFDDHPFSKYPKHVFVICRYRGQWLLTKHKTRGMEFPGGKVEQGETAEQAAVREVKEETGATVDLLRYLGQYHVEGKGDTVIKNIYYAEIADLKQQNSYHETEGPVLLKNLPENLITNKSFSFIMKDDIVRLSLKEIIKHHVSFE